MLERVQLWSCGGGRQSAGIAALIGQGRIKKPDHVCMVALEWEMKSTFKYVNTYIRPMLKSLGIPFTYISRKKYATVGFWSTNDDSLLLPAFTNKSGKNSKLPEFCSGEWKTRVAMRWANEQSGWKERGVDCWLGISWEERKRRRSPQTEWYQPAYPLLDWMPKVFSVNACLDAVSEMGWPVPPRSRCKHCPNQQDSEWSELTAEEWDNVCNLEDELRERDPNAFFHKSMIPLRQVQLKPENDTPGLFGGCSSGMCY